MDRLTYNFREFLAGLTLLMLVALIAQRADAAELTGTFSYPTVRTGGEPFSASEVREVRVEYGLCAAGGAFPTTPAGTVVVPAPTKAYTVPNVGPGTWCLRAKLVDTGGLESAYTGTVTRVIQVSPPNPPTLFTVSTVAYELRQYSNGTLRFVQVGTVPRDAECGLQLVPGFATFDGARITKPTTGGVIAAKCAARS